MENGFGNNDDDGIRDLSGQNLVLIAQRPCTRQLCNRAESVIMEA